MLAFTIRIRSIPLLDFRIVTIRSDYYASLKVAMSNDLGYMIFQGTSPTPEKIEAAKAEISAENLRKFQQSLSSLGFEKLGWGEHSDTLFHDGLDVRVLLTARHL